MDGDALEKIYRENLEERIILRLSEMKELPLEKAMDVYYRSRLAERIYSGSEGVQYLDPKVLCEILCSTEESLFD